MPTKKQHVTKAEHDESFAASLEVESTPFLDWVINALFYAALHYVEAYFATLGRHSTDHRARDSSIQRDPRLRAIYNDYNELKNYSINAHYYVYPFTPKDVDVVLKPHLEALKSHIKPLL